MVGVLMLWSTSAFWLSGNVSSLSLLLVDSFLSILILVFPSHTHTHSSLPHYNTNRASLQRQQQQCVPTTIVSAIIIVIIVLCPPQKTAEWRMLSRIYYCFEGCFTAGHSFFPCFSFLDQRPSSSLCSFRRLPFILL